MSIANIIRERGIREIMHFTTAQGLTGILHQHQVKARAYLKEDETLEFILKINTQKVFDAAWKGYVNLSISRINHSLFGFSQNWHPEAKWRILAFDPMILTHPGTHFVTTNNAYFQHLIRGEGPESLARLFDTKVSGVYGRTVQRTEEMPAFFTTDIQAEVLYPKALSTEWLRTIYVPSSEDAGSVAAKIATLLHSEIPITVCPEKFTNEHND